MSHYKVTGLESATLIRADGTAVPMPGFVATFDEEAETTPSFDDVEVQMQSVELSARFYFDTRTNFTRRMTDMFIWCFGYPRRQRKHSISLLAQTHHLSYRARRKLHPKGVHPNAHVTDR